MTLHPWKLTALRKAVAVETRAKASPTKAMLRENRSQKAKTREKERRTPVMTLETNLGREKEALTKARKVAKELTKLVIFVGKRDTMHATVRAIRM